MHTQKIKHGQPLGLIGDLREEINKLRETGFRISKVLEEEILRVAEKDLDR